MYDKLVGVFLIAVRTADDFLRSRRESSYLYCSGRQVLHYGQIDQKKIPIWVRLLSA